MSEHDLQKQIIAYLRLRKFLCFETDVMDGLKFFSPKDSRRFAFIKHHNDMGYIKGQPDLIILLPIGNALFVEVKTAKGRQSDEQKEFQRRVESLGFNYLIWRSVDDAVLWSKKILQNDFSCG